MHCACKMHTALLSGQGCCRVTLAAHSQAVNSIHFWQLSQPPTCCFPVVVCFRHLALFGLGELCTLCTDRSAQRLFEGWRRCGVGCSNIPMLHNMLHLTGTSLSKS
eukprot:jgi/Ulvmu1/11825/UM080_0036.1